MCQVCGEGTAVNKEVKSLLFWSLHSSGENSKK